MIVPYEQLPDIQKKNSDGRLVGLKLGAFDLLHVGHMRCLDHLRGLVGDSGIVVVGVWGDDFIRTVKHRTGPYHTAADRVELIDGLRPVDVAFVVPEGYSDRLMGSLAMVGQVKPDVLLLGGEVSLPAGDYQTDGRRLRVVEDPGYAQKRDSTTQILQRMGHGEPVNGLALDYTRYGFALGPPPLPGTASGRP